jgi:virginiamycin B lyase
MTRDLRDRSYGTLTAIAMLASVSGCAGSTLQIAANPYVGTTSGAVHGVLTRPDSGPAFVEIDGVRATAFWAIASDNKGGEWFWDGSNSPPSIVEISETTHKPSFFSQSRSLNTFALGFDKKSMWFGSQDNSIIGNISLASPHVIRIAKVSEIATLTAGPDKAMWFTEPGRYRIARYDPATHIISSFPVPHPGEPLQITLGSDGGLWFTTSNAMIGRIDPTTHDVSEFNVQSVWRITSGPDGAIWFTTFALKIGRLDVATHHVSYFDVDVHNGMNLGGIVSRDGELWFTYYGGYIGEFNPASQSINVYTIPDPTSGPDQIALGADDQLWVTEDNASRILLVCPDLSKSKCAKR